MKILPPKLVGDQSEISGYTFYHNYRLITGKPSYSSKGGVKCLFISPPYFSVQQ